MNTPDPTEWFQTMAKPRIPEPSAALRILTQEMRELQAAMTEAGFTTDETHHHLQMQICIGLAQIRESRR
jgi:hypothetical protein